MSLLRKLQRVIRFPWLLWLSIADIHSVRNRIIGLFLAGDQSLLVAPPESVFGTREVRIFGGANPLFEFLWAPVGIDPIKMRFWLCVTGKWTVPYWAYQFDGMEVPKRMKFSDRQARIPALLVKHYHQHFPFVGTNNYIVRDEVASCMKS